MSVFKIMDGEFGTDGLISSHVLYTFATADECFRKIIEVAKNGDIFERSDAPGWWVEEHRDATHSPIYVTEPWPQVSKPDYPDWFKAEYHKLTIPTNKEVLAAIRDIGKKVDQIDFANVLVAAPGRR